MQTPVSQTPYLALMNPYIFPNPEKFDPDRWITAAQNGRRLDRYLVSFARGSRQCLGIKLVVLSCSSLLFAVTTDRLLKAWPTQNFT